MPEKQKYYLTTAISYPNGPPHIGHAYEAIATDALARFMEQDGYDVFFLTGTDEHGIKMLQAAREREMVPQQLADENTNHFIEMTAKLGLSHDDFIRTTEPRHHAACRAIWQRMHDNGDIYKDVYAGWYSIRDEAYYDESETTLNQHNQRIGPQGTPVEWVKEESLFFRLSAYEDRLLAHYDAHAEFIGPRERRNEVISFVKGGLQDLSVSRTSFDWGIPVPDEPGHVMYVWVDALTNYIAATGFPDDTKPRAAFWPADLHIIGKDIIRFHTVYWPAFLMSAGLPLPKRVFAHGFLFNRGEKMSKSLGNVIDPITMVDHYGLDQIRYFFLREVPFGQDGNYSHEAIVARINADLANDLGNLAQRSLSMIAKNCEGKVPDCGDFMPEDKTILAAAEALLTSLRQHHGNQALHRALEDIWRVISDSNKYFAGQEPWALKKTDPVRMHTVLYVTAEILRRIGILCWPYMPDASSRLLDILAIPEDARRFEHLDAGHALISGTDLPAPAPIFPRYIEPSDD